MLVHPDDLANWRTNQPRTQSVTGGRLLEMRLRHKDGRYIWVEISSKLILDPESREPIEIVRATRDITERKRAEEQIRQALQKEREISEMKSRFISSTSHEFRTPMTAAAGSAELLRTHFNKLTEQKRNELLGRIESAVQRVIVMLDDVLTVSRMESGKTKFKPVPVNLAAILHDLVSEAQLADKDAHQIHLEVPAGNSDATADNALIRTIIGNLISNALRYSPKGTEVRVWLVMQENSALIAVKDQGIGIPESDRARIFQAFERGSNVGQIKGTGLGLNIVRRMVELHGGTLDFTSQIGLGTTFTVWIPIIHQ
jgi:signal transduction histidine kinase